MQFKPGVDSAEFFKLRPAMRLVVEIAEVLLENIAEQELTITEVFRVARHPNDLHPLGRAVDIRTRDLKPGQAQALADAINAICCYDPERTKMRVAIYGDAAHQDHIHLQVHDRTVITATILNGRAFAGKKAGGITNG